MPLGGAGGGLSKAKVADPVPAPLAAKKKAESAFKFSDSFGDDPILPDDSSASAAAAAQRKVAAAAAAAVASQEAEAAGGGFGSRQATPDRSGRPPASVMNAGGCSAAPIPSQLISQAFSPPTIFTISIIVQPLDPYLCSPIQHAGGSSGGGGQVSEEEGDIMGGYVPSFNPGSRRSAPSSPFPGGGSNPATSSVSASSDAFGGVQQPRQRRNINGGGIGGDAGLSAALDGGARVNPLLGAGGGGMGGGGMGAGGGLAKPRSREDEERERTSTAMAAALQRRQDLTASSAAPFRCSRA